MSVAVIVPYLTGVHLFAPDDNRLHHLGKYPTVALLTSRIAKIVPRPSVVVAAGSIEPQPYRAILVFADIVLIPDVWLQSLPKHAIRARAKQAVRFFDAQSIQRIEHIFSPTCPDPIPF
jgi:hypothetical protein